MKRLLPLFPLASLLLVTMAVGPCGSQPLGRVDGGGGACTYQGKTYVSGSNFPSADGCNTCSCNAGLASCTKKACGDAGPATDASDMANACFDNSGNEIPCSSGTCFDNSGNVIACPKSCLYGGSVHDYGSQFTATDGCNICTCGAGGVTCTAKECSDAGPSDAGKTCFDNNGKQISCGDGGISDAGGKDAAQTCFDNNGKQINCSDGGTIGTCVYGGYVFPSGSTFPATDGCNTCSCSAGVVGCTKKACAADGGPGDAPTFETPVIPACTYGADQTCNENPALSSLRGKCQPDGTCVCASGAPSATTGRCPDTATPGCEIHPGQVISNGTTFTCADGCNKCTCSGGVIDMTLIGCPDGGANACNLDEANYAYGFIGGNVVYSDRSMLMPSGTGGDYSLTRTYSARATGTTTTTASCRPLLPKCGDSTAIDIGDIIADLAEPTVQKLMMSTGSSPLLFGIDTRPVDGPVFSIQRAGGQQLLIGAACNGATSCTEIPTGLAKLMKDLMALDQQQLAMPACAAIATGAFPCGTSKCQTGVEFACGASNKCKLGVEYCARATVGGAEKVATCRPYDSACVTPSCACAANDAVNVLRQVSVDSCGNASKYVCQNDSGRTLSDTTEVSAGLSVTCTVP